MQKKPLEQVMGDTKKEVWTVELSGVPPYIKHPETSTELPDIPLVINT